MHSFFAECTYLAGDDIVNKLTLRHFFYFLVAPTLVFKLEYPRSDKRDYVKIVKALGEFFAVIFLCFYALFTFWRENLSDFGKQPLTLNWLAKVLCNSIPYGVLGVFALNYGVMHSWLNFLAETLCFADKR